MFSAENRNHTGPLVLPEALCDVFPFSVSSSSDFWPVIYEEAVLLAKYLRNEKEIYGFQE